MFNGPVRKWSSDLIRQARQIVDSAGDDFDQKWKDLEQNSHEDYFKLAALANFFEDLAILEKEQQVTFAQVVERFAPTLVYYHYKYTGFIADQQKQDPRILANFEVLAKRVSREATS